MHYLDVENTINESASANEPSDSWNPTKISLASDISAIIADLRLNTNVTVADFRRFIDYFQKLISNVMLRVPEKIEEFFKYKNIAVPDDEMKKFIN